MTLARAASVVRDFFEFDAALCRMEFAGELAPLCRDVFPGAALRYDSRHRQGPDAPVTSTWGEFMADLGFDQPEIIAANIAWWREIIKARRITLVIADYAPCALLAARSMGIPAAAIGTGYGLPPACMARFPVLLPEYADFIHDEAETVAQVNAAIERFGLPPISALPQVYTCDDAIATTLPELDPYADARREPLMSPVTTQTDAIADAGEEVFLYFSTTETANPEIVAAIAALGLPTRTYLPGATEEVAVTLRAAGVVVETAPVPLDLLIRRSRLMVNAGQHGILCLGLLAGLPQVALPQHLEHAYHARAAARLGSTLVLSAKDWQRETIADAVRAAYHDAALQSAAGETARRLRANLPNDPAAALRARLELL